LSVPPGVFTSTVPVAAPAGTVVVIKEAETTLKVAAVPLNVTLVAPVSLVPSERAVSRQCHCVRLGSSCALSSMPPHCLRIAPLSRNGIPPLGVGRHASHLIRRMLLIYALLRHR
jgi:hypothetical protein